MFKGKSLMTGAQNTNKSLINPVSTSSQQELQFGTELTNTLQRIQTYYVGKCHHVNIWKFPNLFLHFSH